jgi:hypothetical protein
MRWVIINSDNALLYWSNACGWVTEDYDTFSDEEHDTLSLPMGGKWKLAPWSKKQ